MANAYVAGQAVRIPDNIPGPVIDVGTNEELVAELVKRAALAGAQEQQVADTRAITALADAQARIIQLEQRAEADRKTVDLIAGAHAAAAERSLAAQADAAEARAMVAAVPAVDVSAVARLSAETLENGQRAVNMSATAQEQITALAANTAQQVEGLRAEVEQLQGGATATVDAIQQAAEAINTGVRADVDALLATVPGDVSAAVRARLDQVEVITGGRVKGTSDADRFTWEWTFATLGDPETVSRVVPMPILPGWEGRPGRSAAPVGSSAGGSTAAGRIIGAQATETLVAGVETLLRFRPRPGAAEVTIKQDVDVRFRVVDASISNVWSSAMLTTAVDELPGDEQFGVAAELFGRGGDLGVSFRIERSGIGNQAEIKVYATSPVDAEFVGTISSVVGL